MSQTVTNRTIYDRAATDGAWLGLFITAALGVGMASLHLPLLNLVALTMFLLVPFFVLRSMWRTSADSSHLAQFSALWMQGILTFCCASLILGVCSYLYMRLINPDYIIDTLRMGIAFLRDNPAQGSAEMAAELQNVIDMKAVPSPIDLSVMWLWTGAFSGSVLSALLALIVVARRKLRSAAGSR